MILDYNRKPDATVDEKIQSLMENTQLALNDISRAQQTADVAKEDAQTSVALSQTARQAAADASDAAATAKRAADDATAAVEVIEGDVSGLTTRVAQAESDIDAAESNISSLTGRVADAEGDITTIESNVSSLTGRVADAEDDIDAVEGNISTLQSDVSTAQSNISTIQTNISNLTGRVADAESDIGAVESNITSLSGRVSDAEDEVDDVMKGLALAEDVVGTLNWITAHSTVTTDTTPQQGTVYYIKHLDGTFEAVTDTTGKNPAQEGWYVLDEALQNYVLSHLSLTNDGLWIIKDGSGYKLKLTNYGSYIVAPDGTTVVNQNTADGNIIRALNGTVIAHLGYGEGQAQSGTAKNPYYTFGTRKTTDIPYDSTATYAVGDMCKYNDLVYECIETISQSEQWNPNHWRLVIGNWSLAEGYDNTASGFGSHAEGRDNTASGNDSHAEGNDTTASGFVSHTEGLRTTASGYASHAEGWSAKAYGKASHAEGDATTARGDSSHAEGTNTTAYGETAHAEGNSTTAYGDTSHAEGYMTDAYGFYSHAQNFYTSAERKSQTVMGEFNEIDTHGADETERGKYALIIGNGTGTNNRSNGFTVDWGGKVECGDYQGKITSLIDLAHPKGSTYGTVLPPTINGHSYDDGNLTDAEIEACGDTWFDPRIMWGGTWELMPEGYILLSGSESGSYQVGTDTTTSGYKEYGANTKNITVSNMPSHDHAVNESDSKYFLTIDKSPDNAVSRRTIKNGTGSNLQYNLYSENAITRTSSTGSRGSGSAFNVMQKSIAVYWWIRTA